MSDVDLTFEEQRPRLARLAYRMLGSVADADDVLQEAFLRWSRADRNDVQAPAAYLNSIVVRLCIDQRRVVEARKESYIGPWLPEPIIDAAESDPATPVERAESISLAFLVVLESLSPVERAAYLLRRVFDHDYEQIAAILQKSTANCRQLVHRAEVRIDERRPRFASNPAEAERLTSAFLNVCATGNVQDLVAILSPDAVVYSDGGGKAAAARVPIRGVDRVSRFFAGLIRKAPPGTQVRRVLVNGQPGIVVLIAGQIVTVLTWNICDGRIAECFAIRNPDKLARISLTDLENNNERV